MRDREEDRDLDEVEEYDAEEYDTDEYGDDEYEQDDEEYESEDEEDEYEDAPPSNRKKKKKKKWLLLLLLLLLLIAIGGTGYYVWLKNRKGMDNETKYWFDKMAQDGTLAGKTPTEIQGMLNQIVDEGMYRVSVNARIIFENGKSAGNLGFENIPDNHYFARVIITKDDDHTELYKSNGIKPGQYIDEITLKKNLAQGEYDCTAQIVVTDPDTLDDVGTVEVKVQIIIQN